MNLLALLETHREEILARAGDTLARTHLNYYGLVTLGQNKQYLQTLFDLIILCIKTKTLSPIIAYAEKIGEERFATSSDLYQIHTTFNVLEEILWQYVLTHLPPSEYATALGIVSTIHGIGKDALAQTYVSLATKSQAPSLNLTTMFEDGENRTNL